MIIKQSRGVSVTVTTESSEVIPKYFVTLYRHKSVLTSCDKQKRKIDKFIQWYKTFNRIIASIPLDGKHC